MSLEGKLLARDQLAEQAHYRAPAANPLTGLVLALVPLCNDAHIGELQGEDGSSRCDSPEITGDPDGSGVPPPLLVLAHKALPHLVALCKQIFRALTVFPLILG